PVVPEEAGDGDLSSLVTGTADEDLAQRHSLRQCRAVARAAVRLLVDLAAVRQPLERRELIGEKREGALGRPPAGLGRDGGDVGRDARVLHWLGKNVDGIEVPVRAAVLERAVLPGPEDDLERL